MNVSQGRVIGAIVIAGVLIVTASIGIWAMFLNTDAPAPVSLQEAVASIVTSTPESDDESAGTFEDDNSLITATAEAMIATAASTATEEMTEGERADAGESASTTIWSVATGTESFVGYRIGEELASIGTTEAVGRTTSVTGTVTISGSVVESATFEANLQDLTSDDSRRDRTLQDRGLETASYPTGSFMLTQPVDLGGELIDGAIYSIVATGELTLHGVTLQVEFPMEAQYVGGTLVVVGSLEIELADYGITAPTTRIALAVDDHGTMEIQLILSRAS